MDNRTFRRLVYEVLDHDPTKADIARFFRHFWGLLLRRGLVLRGITTDGSPLYPEPIAQVFGDVSHQICEFHVIKDLNLAVLRAVAKVRKQIAATMPEVHRGAPRGQEAKQRVRRRARLQRKITELFDHRHLFVRRDLTSGQRQILLQITRGVPSLRPLRQIVDEIYRLFDRRCRLDTALAKLSVLRRRVRRFPTLRRSLSRLFNPAMSKALTFLDDALLPSTSNAVERGNRRHRKMQKSTYRVRTRENLVGRMALDLLRDQRLANRPGVIDALHEQRARPVRARHPTPARPARRGCGRGAA